MSLDPREIPGAGRGAHGGQARVIERIAELGRRLAALERSRAAVQVGDGPPTVAARDGTLHLDRVTGRLYVRSNGTWRYVTLT